MKMDKRRPEVMISHVGETVLEGWAAVISFISFVGEVTAACRYALIHPQKIRWKDVRFYMSVCGPDGMPITVMICFLMGVILAYQSALQMHKYGADIFLPGLIGCTISRELGPLMVAVVATGRSGSAFAAEIATMKVSEELNALTTMGFSTSRFLVIPKMIAMLTMLPLLTVVGDFVGMAGGFVIGVGELDLSIITYMQKTRDWVSIAYFMEGIAKSFVFAWLITMAGCWCGFETTGDSVGVGKATTRSVVMGIFMVVMADAVLAKIFSVLYSLGQ